MDRISHRRFDLAGNVDIGMIPRGCRAYLADRALTFDIPGIVSHTHATIAELFKDPIMGYCRPLISNISSVTEQKTADPLGPE